MKIYRNSGPHLFLLFWKAAQSVARFDKASIGKSGFKVHSDFVILEVLLHKGAMPVNAIGETVHLTSGSITTAVQRLERRGHVRRERCPKDGRVVHVHLTEAGQALIEESFAKHAANLDQLFDILDPVEREQFALLVRKVGQRADSINL